MQDKFTGKSRGFAFITMGSDEDAQNAISKLNGQTDEGRALTVNEARPREPRPPGAVVDAATAGRRRIRWPPRRWPAKRPLGFPSKESQGGLGRAGFEPAKA